MCLVGDIYFEGVKNLKFYCCGLVYSTQDPNTYWCIETYYLKNPIDDIIGGKRVCKQVVYVLCCKVHGCTKLELHSYTKENGVLKLIFTQSIKGSGVAVFLEKTKSLRIKQPQICPYSKIQYAKKIPWVYGKTINGTTQVVRYIDESGNRKVFKDNKLVSEIIKAKVDERNV